MRLTFTITGGHLYSRTFYLRIRLFRLAKSGQNEHFICEFKIGGPKWRNISTANKEGNLYYQIELTVSITQASEKS
jgi:hypothetical protein